MGNFTFYAPTRVYFGRKEEEQIGSILKQEGCHRVLVHYGGQSAVKSGLLDRVLASLKKAGISAVTLGGLIAGACIAGIGSALVQILVWKLGGSILRKRALLFVGSSCLTMDIMRLLPGYTVTDKFGALVLLAVFCLMVLGVTELTVKKEIK